MKFRFFNLYSFIQVNLNRIFSVCVCVWKSRDREKCREGQREKKLLLISVAHNHQCSFVWLSCGIWSLYSNTAELAVFMKVSEIYLFWAASKIKTFCWETFGKNITEQLKISKFKTLLTRYIIKFTLTATHHSAYTQREANWGQFPILLSLVCL